MRPECPDGRRAAIPVIAAALLIALAAPPALADHVDVDRDRAAGTITLRIEAPGGELAWSDVVRGLARARGFDDEALLGLLPPGTVDIDSLTGRLAIVALSRTLEPAIRFEVETSGKGTVLAVHLSRAALQATERRFLDMLQGKASRVSAADGYGLELDDGWQRRPRSRPLVILIHGLDSTPETTSVTSLRPALIDRGVPTGVFRYPNDQPIARSAALLAEELAEIAERSPKRDVVLIGKSMGGLVARAAIEDPELDPGNVSRLIQIATPNRGSNLAHLAFALELWEHVPGLADQGAVETFYRSIEDGLGQAAEDLVPGSPFLQELNARPRNPKVDYSIFLGRRGYLTRTQLIALRLALRQAMQRNRLAQFLGPKLDALLADLDEVVDGAGDGAVSLERGKLDGVDDVVILDFDHLDASEGGSAASQRLRRGVLERAQ